MNTVMMILLFINGLCISSNNGGMEYEFVWYVPKNSTKIYDTVIKCASDNNIDAVCRHGNTDAILITFVRAHNQSAARDAHRRMFTCVYSKYNGEELLEATRNVPIKGNCQYVKALNQSRYLLKNLGVFQYELLVENRNDIDIYVALFAAIARSRSHIANIISMNMNIKAKCEDLARYVEAIRNSVSIAVVNSRYYITVIGNSGYQKYIDAYINRTIIRAGELAEKAGDTNNIYIIDQPYCIDE